MAIEHNKTFSRIKKQKGKISMSQRKADKARIIIGAMFRDGMNKQEMLDAGFDLWRL